MKTLATALASATMLLATSALADKDYVILELGDTEIKKSEVETIWNGLFPGGKAPEFDSVEEPIRQNILRGVVSEYLLYEEAAAAGTESQKDVKEKIEEAKRKIVVRQFIEDKTKEMITDKDLKKEYDELVKANRGKEEVRARHILVDSEDKAKDIKKQLDDGADFEKLAAKESKDPGSKAQGGDLGFFAEGVMVKPFSEAAFKLKDDEISEPVKSSFGWHIIKTIERRKMKTPSFSDMKKDLRDNLVEERLNDYVNRLVDQTAVRYFDAKGNEKDFTKVPDHSK